MTRAFSSTVSPPVTSIVGLHVEPAIKHFYVGVVLAPVEKVPWLLSTLPSAGPSTSLVVAMSVVGPLSVPVGDHSVVPTYALFYTVVSPPSTATVSSNVRGTKELPGVNSATIATESLGSSPAAAVVVRHPSIGEVDPGCSSEPKLGTSLTPVAPGVVPTVPHLPAGPEILVNSVEET